MLPLLFVFGICIAGFLVLGVLFDDERRTGLRRAGERDVRMPALPVSRRPEQKDIQK